MSGIVVAFLTVVTCCSSLRRAGAEDAAAAVFPTVEDAVNRVR